MGLCTQIAAAAAGVLGAAASPAVAGGARPQLQHGGEAASVAFDASERRLASWTSDQVDFWDLRSGRQISSVAVQHLRSVVFAGAGDSAVAVAYEQPLRVLDVGSGAITREVGAGVTACNASLDGGRIFAADAERIHVFDARSWVEVAALELPGVGAIRSDRSGRTLVLEHGGTFELWDIESRAMLRQLNTAACGRDTVTGLVMRPDGSEVAAMCGHRVVRWSSAASDPSALVEYKDNDLRLLSYDLDGRLWLVAWHLFEVMPASEGGGALRNARGNARNFEEASLTASVLAISSSGRRVVRESTTRTVGERRAPSLELRDLASFEVLHRLDRRMSAATSMTFFERERQVVAATSQGLAVFDLTRLKMDVLPETQDQMLEMVVASPDGASLYTADQRGVRALSRAGVTSWTGPFERGRRLKVSGDGTLLLHEGWDGHVRVVDAKTGRLRLDDAGPVRLSLAPVGAWGIAVTPHAGHSMDDALSRWSLARTGFEKGRPHPARRSVRGEVVILPGGLAAVHVSGSGSGNRLELIDAETLEPRFMRDVPREHWLNGEVCATPDGEELWVAARSGTVLVFSGRTLEPRGELAVPGLGNPQSMNCGQTWIAVASGATGAIHVIDRSARRPLVQMFAAVDRASGADFVFLSPEGYYAASPGGLRALSWVIDGRAYSPEVDDLGSNRPDLLAERLGAPAELVNLLRDARRRRIERLGRRDGALRSPEALPRVELTGAPLPATTVDESVRLQVTAGAPKGTIDRIHVAVNGAPLSAAGLPVKKPSKSVTLEVDVPLGYGRNAIEVSASVSGTESPRESAVVVRTSHPPPPELYVLGIAVADYDGEDHDLAFPVKDARDVIAALEGKGDRVGAVHTKLLADRDVTLASVRGAKDFFAPSRPDDQAIVFVAGHGLLDERLDYYFPTSATDFEAPSRLGVPYAALEEVMDGIGARSRLLLVDTCHSGELDEPQLARLASVGAKVSGGRGVIAKQRKTSSPSVWLGHPLFADLSRGAGVTVLASASGAELAFESEMLANGLFAHAVISVLSSGDVRNDVDRDGVTRVSELAAVVARRVGRHTAGVQNPGFRRRNVMADFSVHCLSRPESCLAYDRAGGW